MVHSTAPQAKILGHSVTFARFYLQNSYFEDQKFQNFPCPQKVSGKNVYMGALKCFEYIRLRIYIYTKKNTGLQEEKGVRGRNPREKNRVLNCIFEGKYSQKAHFAKAGSNRICKYFVEQKI